MTESDWNTMEAALITPNAIGQRGRDVALAALSRRREEEKRLRGEDRDVRTSLSHWVTTGVKYRSELTSLRKQLEGLVEASLRLGVHAVHTHVTPVDTDALGAALELARIASEHIDSILDPEQETP